VAKSIILIAISVYRTLRRLLLPIHREDQTEAR
jgi:hypothetical protein